MEGRKKKSSSLLPLMFISVICLSIVAEGAISLGNENLVRQFYKKNGKCKSVEAFVRHQVNLYVSKDKSLIPQLARLLYTDCFSSGCDGSALLGGKDSGSKLGVFGLIKKIKTVVEHYCPNVVSCSDILNLATRDAIHMAGGPSYPIRTGRKDGKTAPGSYSKLEIPPPNMSLQDTIKSFASKELDILDMTTIIGVLHGLGEVPCSEIKDRLYNHKGTKKADPSIEKSTLADLKSKCPENGDGMVFINPDSGTSYMLGSSFFQRILAYKAVLSIDQQLLYNEDTLEITQLFANETTDGFEDFRKSMALSMSRLGEVDVLTGNEGEIRKECSSTN